MEFLLQGRCSHQAPPRFSLSVQDAVDWTPIRDNSRCSEVVTNATPQDGVLQIPLHSDMRYYREFTLSSSLRDILNYSIFKIIYIQGFHSNCCISAPNRHLSSSSRFHCSMAPHSRIAWDTIAFSYQVVTIHTFYGAISVVAGPKLG